MSKTRRMGSLASSTGFETFVLDQLEDLGDLASRKMFGGVGLYSRGLFFGIIARDELYLKVDEATRAARIAAGSVPFRPYRTRGGTTRYYSVPVSVLESAPELVRWARKAVDVARKG
jgi:TfoX/Sxy family transcriptional regulator of competence genes